MPGVIIRVDPHKLSATLEIVDQHGHLLGGGRFATDKARLHGDAQLCEGLKDPPPDRC
jgi:hypothetical protein